MGQLLVHFRAGPYGRRMPEQGQDSGSSGPVRYLALGDSYTIGTGASGPEAAFPSRLRPRLEEYAGLAVSIPDWSVTPAARGFRRPDELRTRIETCNAIAQVEARTHGFLWADVSEVSRALGRDGLSEDGLHPDDRQYEAWAEAIWSAVGPRWASGLDAGADLGP